MKKRKSGILLPIYSLPSKYGIGSLGEEAYNFVDFLVRTGQSIWQILPITSTSEEDYFSPYKTTSAFSGNYDLIDIDLMVNDGFIDRYFVDNTDISRFNTDPRYIKYENVRELKSIFFNEAYKQFFNSVDNFQKDRDDRHVKFDEFLKNSSFWLDKFSSYLALREINDGKKHWDWTICEKDIYKNQYENGEKISRYYEIQRYHKFLQYIFFSQWKRLKEYANANKIEILGDIPIYVSEESSDFYFSPHLFLVDDNNVPKLISGVPPDGFSEDGQCWGNPLYNWSAMKLDGYSWWIKRLEKSLELFDILRIDHFRGFESYYCIDKHSKDARNGFWEIGPGRDFFIELKNTLPNANIIAEDLGIITDEVRDLLEFTGFPGMKVLQFGFDSDSLNLNLPHMYSSNSVAYTGTHDNKTVAEWLTTEKYETVDFAKKYLRLETYNKYTEGFIRSVMSSSSDTAIIPIQDWLDFGGWARMNTPSTIENNWKFRLLSGELNNDLAEYISYITGLYGRYLKY